jgi:hypothetical protein
MSIFFNKHVMLAATFCICSMTNMLSGNESLIKEQTANKQQKEYSNVIRGELFRIPVGMFKAGQKDCDALKKHGYEIEAKKKDTFVKVWATSKGYPDTLIIHLSKEEREDKEGSCNWADHGHPRLPNFPAYLPLKLFIDETGNLKKDGDEVVFSYNDTQNNNEYPYANSAFQAMDSFGSCFDVAEKYSNKRIKIILTLNQRGYRYGGCGNDYFDGKCHEGGFDNCIRASKDYEKLVKPYLSK